MKFSKRQTDRQTERQSDSYIAPLTIYLFQNWNLFQELLTFQESIKSLFYTVQKRSMAEKIALPFGNHVFQAKVTIFELIQDIIGTNHLSKFHEDRKIIVASRVLTRKNAPPPWRPYIIGMNLLTKFYEDRTINVASIVKNAPPLGSHVFQASVIIFELIQDIIETNLLTKFHEDWTINVASRE
ncbi:hypothetical protein DPMN_005112 [Dreissena polymorpha]|uniref:Uncharacterized protein n=1 Tax=Dreissena polymorpha TaxID=45954 RepID=A0A9D4RU45_DREPO|nr:hypothetical protein DPMN_005112 [Dreissena polymorpha]